MNGDSTQSAERENPANRFTGKRGKGGSRKSDFSLTIEIQAVIMAELRHLAEVGPGGVTPPGASPRANLINQLTRAFSETVELKRRLKMQPLPAVVEVPFKVLRKAAAPSEVAIKDHLKEIFGISA